MGFFTVTGASASGRADIEIGIWQGRENLSSTPSGGRKAVKEGVGEIS